MRKCAVKVNFTPKEKDEIEKMFLEQGHLLSYGMRILALKAYKEHMGNRWRPLIEEQTTKKELKVREVKNDII